MTWNGGLTFLLIERVADCRQRVVPLLCLPQRIAGRPGEGLKAASDSCIAAHFQVPNDNRDTLYGAALPCEALGIRYQK